MQLSSFGLKKLAPCKKFSWLLNWHLKMAPGDFSDSYFLGARAAPGKIPIQVEKIETCQEKSTYNRNVNSLFVRHSYVFFLKVVVLSLIFLLRCPIFLPSGLGFSTVVVPSVDVTVFLSLGTKVANV